MQSWEDLFDDIFIISFRLPLIVHNGVFQQLQEDLEPAL